MSTVQPRQPAGTPQGGQWASISRTSAPDLDEPGLIVSAAAGGGTMVTRTNDNHHIHGIDTPAIQFFDADGNLTREDYYDNGKILRSIDYSFGWADESIGSPHSRHSQGDAPARIIRDDKGRVRGTYWYADNTLHREGGPAHIMYGPDGEVVDVAFYHHGVHVPLPKVEERDGMVVATSGKDMLVITDAGTPNQKVSAFIPHAGGTLMFEEHGGTINIVHEDAEHRYHPFGERTPDRVRLDYPSCPLLPEHRSRFDWAIRLHEEATHVS